MEPKEHVVFIRGRLLDIRYVCAVCGMETKRDAGIWPYALANAGAPATEAAHLTLGHALFIAKSNNDGGVQRHFWRHPRCLRVPFRAAYFGRRFVARQSACAYVLDQINDAVQRIVNGANETEH
jgi:hypothetical protein